MDYWPHQVRPYSKSEVFEHAVNNQEWQTFRISLKGLSTHEKLTRLDELRQSKLAQYWANKDVVTPDDIANDELQQLVHYLPRKWEVAIDNYINALRRGGQLDTNNRVQN
jgi:hypothetical protein